MAPNQRSETNKQPLEPVRVIGLADAPGEHVAWDRPKAVIYMWAAVELLLVTNPWQVSSRLRVQALRAFGAVIENGVTFRPRTRVKFPWKLRVGADSWIGEGVWFHNQDTITVGRDVVISQEAFLTTGSHALRQDMRLITKPISVHDGAWITSRCVILGGSEIGRSAVIAPNSVVRGRIDANAVVAGSPAEFVAHRFQR